MAERQLIDVVLSGIIGAAVVQESANHTARTARCVDNQGETVELADCVNASSANRSRTVANKPDVEVTTAAIGAIGSEVDVGDPLGSEQRLLTPYGTALVTGSERSEDNSVGENLGSVWVALDGEVGNLSTSLGRTYPIGGRRVNNVSWVEPSW